MRWRVAVTATLLNMLVCLLLLSVCAYSAADLQNELIEEELRVTCRLSAEMMDSAAFANMTFENAEFDTRDDYLSAIADENGMQVAYIRRDGKVAFKNFEGQIDSELARKLMKSKGDGVETFPYEGEDGVVRICANRRLKDGSVVTFLKNNVGKFSFAGHYSLLVLIAVCCLAAQLIIIERYVGRSDKLTGALMKVLEDFTEGNFTTRITDVKGFPGKLAAEYNATLARIQDRVFSQVRKNRVVGQLLNQMHNGLITVGTDLSITFTNGNAGQLFGADVSEAVGRSLSEVFNNEDLEKAFTQAMSSTTGNVVTTETDGMTPSGSVRPVRIYTSTMSSQGVCTGALAVVEDITEIRKLEQIRTDFAANVSHEMKTPLTSIKGFIETLQAGAIDNPELARKFLDIMMSEAERLYRLINDILSITKLESGSENVEITRINLMDVVNYVARGPLLKPQASLKNVTINVNNPSEEPAWIMGNKDRVQQLVINLVENGVKYNKQDGTVTVTVMQDKDNVHFIVADTGIGIKEENLGRLFERFYRVDKGRSREMGGTGLGLAICKHIVHTMNGFIEVNSKYGEGTEFLVTIPKAPAIEEAPDSDDMEDEFA